MKRIYSSHNHMLVVLMKEMLEAKGVRCLVKNELLAGAAGELPPIECWPELWIIDHDQYEWAQSLVAAALKVADQHRPTWRCTQCGESLEGQFTQCWSCGRMREGGRWDQCGFKATTEGS